MNVKWDTSGTYEVVDARKIVVGVLDGLRGTKRIISRKAADVLCPMRAFPSVTMRFFSNMFVYPSWFEKDDQISLASMVFYVADGVS